MRALAVTLAMAFLLLTPTSAQADSSPPPPGGYFTLQPVGSWSSLPDDASCAAQVHQSTWEPRPENYKQNTRVLDPAKVHHSLAIRPRDTDGSYNPLWDSWLMPRVDGQYVGTTDEIIQWAACKWGLPDEVLRGIAVRESTWYAYLHYKDGEPYPNRGSGDIMPSDTPDSEVYCNGIAKWGVDYQTFYGKGICPKTFGLTGIMSWEAPSWGQMKGNQNGTFPFNRNSTAFDVDYIGSYLRGCYEGWVKWLNPSGGDLWGCVGSWYSGDWHSAAADGYISRVQNEIANQTWTQPSFLTGQYQCDPVKGCPV
jgi:hypothetical protein